MAAEIGAVRHEACTAAFAQLVGPLRVVKRTSPNSRERPRPKTRMVVDLCSLRLLRQQGEFSFAESLTQEVPSGVKQSHRPHRLGHSEELDHAFEVVGKDMQVHLSTHMLQPAHQEVR